MEKLLFLGDYTPSYHVMRYSYYLSHAPSCNNFPIYRSVTTGICKYYIPQLGKSDGKTKTVRLFSSTNDIFPRNILNWRCAEGMCRVSGDSFASLPRSLSCFSSQYGADSYHSLADKKYMSIPKTSDKDESELDWCNDKNKKRESEVKANQTVSGNSTCVVQATNESYLDTGRASVPGQMLYLATQEDINILKESKRKYPKPLDVEGGVIIRLVRLCDPVTSPVSRAVRNNLYGIRGKERWAFLVYGLSATGFTLLLCYWQLSRMKWKRELIDLRRERLAYPRIYVDKSPFPWFNDPQDWSYRCVEMRGVLDTTVEYRIGPRPGLTVGNPGYLIVSPLRLIDGNTIMVNRGHCSIKNVDERNEIPQWVTIRGVLEPGEITSTLPLMDFWKRIQNKPSERKFVYLHPQDLGSVSGAQNLQECKLMLLNAFDLIYEDDYKISPDYYETKTGGSGSPDIATILKNKRKRRQLCLEMKQKGDYLSFWADEHTHFNYAMQWLILSGVFLSMTVFRFVEFTRWKF